MQKAVEKRKATLAAKKAAQVAAEQRNGTATPGAGESGPSRPPTGAPAQGETGRSPGPAPIRGAYQSNMPGGVNIFSHGYQNAAELSQQGQVRQMHQQQYQVPPPPPQQYPTQPYAAEYPNHVFHHYQS